MRFSKMHGAGNDYVYVDCFTESIPGDPPGLARQVSNRHFGIGSDGLVLVLPDPVADARMQMFNADGSEAEMCGNALRCVGWLLRDRSYCDQDRMRIRTGRGILEVVVTERTGNRGCVRVDMGPPRLGPNGLEPDDPAAADSAVVQLSSDGTSVNVVVLSMGNPHCVVFCESVDAAPVRSIGAELERHAAFPERTNVEFAEVADRDRLRVRVWERGSGETLACGTGAAASVVAGVVTGRCDRRCLVQLPGGELHVDWAPHGSVWMTGPVVEVYRGEWLHD